MSNKWKDGKDDYMTKEDKDSGKGKAKKPSKSSPTESKSKKLKRGSMMEKIVKGYAKGMGSDCK